MGCTASSQLGPFPNCLLIRNISEQHKQILGDSIEDNDAILMALQMQQINAYPNSQISESKMGWMFTHLCCRWDSEACLDYLLRNYFAENPKGYVNFVNGQTAEGYTCLHICAIWKSIKCFNVLLSLGGLDLSIKDDKLKTAYEKSIQYKCPEIANVLQEHKKFNVVFKEINMGELSDGPLMRNSIQIAESTSSKNIYAIDQNLKENLFTILQWSNQQGKLHQEKTQIEKVLENLLQTKLKTQLDYDNKRNNILSSFENEQYQKQQYEKSQKKVLDQQMKKQFTELQGEIILNQNKLKQANSEIRKRQQQKLKAIKQKQQAKIQETAISMHQIFTQKIKQNNEFLKKNKTQRSSIRPSIRVRQTTVFITADDQAKMKQQLNLCPPDIIKKYQQAKQIGIFIDEQFPAKKCSIGQSTKLNYKQFTQNTIWLRPRQIFKSDFKLFDGIDPDDIKQGSLGVCYMLATVSALATNPKNITNIFVFHDISIGFYVLKLFVNGIPKYFVVDDLIPCCKTTKSPLFTQPIGKQVWVLLLQKAWAKLVGNYLSAQSMTADHMMQDLSGAPGYGWWLNKQGSKTSTQKIKQIVKHTSRGHIVVITSVPDHQIQGIVNNHAYTLLNVFEYNHRYIFKIRNPWGCFQWNGEYGENSSLCNQQFKLKVGYDNKNDGIFYISENQLLKAFCFYSISQIKTDFDYSFIPFSSKKYEDVFFKLTLDQPSDVNIRVIQPFDRMLKGKDYKYSPLIFQVGKINNNKVKFLSEGHQRTYFGSKSVHAFQDIYEYLQKGEYFIRVRMLWANDQRYNEAVLGCYASDPVKLQTIDYEEGIKLMKQLFFSYSQTFKKNRASNGLYTICTMKGQFVFVVQTEQQGEFKVNFKFSKAKMLKTQMDLGKVNSTELSTKIDKQNKGVVTAMRTQPALGGTTGPVNITFLKV